MKIEILNNHIGIFYQAFDKEFCDSFIEYFKILEDLKYVHQRNNYKTKDMTVDIIVEKYYNSSFPLNANLGNFLKKMFDNCYIHYRNKYPILNELHSHSIRNVLLQKTKPGEGYFHWHCEKDHTTNKDRVCAFTLYLNDVEEGGETAFLYQDLKIKPEQGKLLIWPAQYTHTHKGNSPISNNKYILTGWIEYV
tara:strand:+ start:2274 stop:2852 length:579 start_codon:yes stop_codon:yes gene_type:complete